jgi:Tfp pilus assembly protein PilO
MNGGNLRELLQLVPFNALFAAYALYAGYNWYVFSYQGDSPLGQQRTQLEAEKSKSAEMQKRLTDARQFFKTLSAKREELRTLAVELDQMRTVLTEDLDVAGLIKIVVTEARRVQISVVSIKPLALVAGEYYDEQPFELQFRGVYAQLLVFLERLSKMERNVRIDEFEIKRVGTSGPYTDLEGKVKIRAYRYKGSRADDLARTGGSEKVGGDEAAKKGKP